jgi:hypothetical protein
MVECSLFPFSERKGRFEGVVFEDDAFARIRVINAPIDAALCHLGKQCKNFQTFPPLRLGKSPNLD